MRVSGAVFKAESECLGECGRGKSGFPLLVGNIALTVRPEHFYVQLRNRMDVQGAQCKLVCEEKLSEGECPVPPAVTPWHSSGIPSSQTGSSGGRAILAVNILALVKHLVCKS